MMTIADLRLSSTAPQRQRRLVCRRRWPSFATLPTDCYWGVNAAVPYCGCILIPLLPVVGWWSDGNKGCRALGGSLQKDKSSLSPTSKPTSSFARMCFFFVLTILPLLEASQPHPFRRCVFFVLTTIPLISKPTTFVTMCYFSSRD